MRLIFLGSPGFAAPSLERLLAAGHAVPLVVTQPDRAAGRGKALRAPEVKRIAAAHGLDVVQPETLTDPEAVRRLAAVEPDALVVVAFGQYLPRGVRELGRFGCVNLHASLLPRYRGAAPIAWALINGERETGVSVMRVNARMDAGPVLLQRATAIAAEEDAGGLAARLSALGADALVDALERLETGRAIWAPQDERRATWAPKLRDEDCHLGLDAGPPALVNRVRGLAPAPGAYLRLRDGRRLRVLQAAVAEGTAAPGVVAGVEPDGLVLGAGRGALALLEVQPEGRRRMTGAEFARGLRLRPGDQLV